MDFPTVTGAQQYELSLSNNIGQQVAYQSFSGISSSMDFSNFASGMYFLKIKGKSPGDVCVLKVLKY
ncbi:MAG: T9SS type A sorting domain-containing protein [Chitinophagaceae bacterium]